jgi:hypothetical protein
VSVPVRSTLIALLLALAGCDQFAKVGIRNRESDNAGAPAPPSGGGGGETGAQDAATANDAGPAQDAAAQCEPFSVEGCNPVTNETCPDSLAMQCAIDHLAILTGYCIFSSPTPPALGGDCLNTGVTESCPPTSTCVDGTCRELCYCDIDCTAGTCCTDPVADTGFKVCGDC